MGNLVLYFGAQATTACAHTYVSMLIMLSWCVDFRLAWGILRKANAPLLGAEGLAKKASPSTGQKGLNTIPQLVFPKTEHQHDKESNVESQGVPGRLRTSESHHFQMGDRLTIISRDRSFRLTVRTRSPQRVHMGGRARHHPRCRVFY